MNSFLLCRRHHLRIYFFKFILKGSKIFFTFFFIIKYFKIILIKKILKRFWLQNITNMNMKKLISGIFKFWPPRSSYLSHLWGIGDKNIIFMHCFVFQRKNGYSSNPWFEVLQTEILKHQFLEISKFVTQNRTKDYSFFNFSSYFNLKKRKKKPTVTKFFV